MFVVKAGEKEEAEEGSGVVEEGSGAVEKARYVKAGCGSSPKKSKDAAGSKKVGS